MPDRVVAQDIDSADPVGAAIEAAVAEAAPPTALADDRGMGREERLVRLLFKRIEAAQGIKDEWEQRYEVNRCHDYVYGFQRDKDEARDAQGDRKYILNRILAALKAKIPSVFYYHPYYRVAATRGREDTPATMAAERAALLQDTLNTIVRESRTRFKPEAMAAVKEAQWAFGVVETGYAADWGENPFARKPTLVEDEEARRELEADATAPGLAGGPPVRLPDGSGFFVQDVGTGMPDAFERDVAAEMAGPDADEQDPLADLDQVPHSETFFVRHIPARQFLVSSNDKSATESLDWVAHWDWMYVEDVKRAPGFTGAEDLKATGKYGAVDKALAPLSREKDDPPADMVRVWRYWDLREGTRYVLAEGHNRLLRRTRFERLDDHIHELRLEIPPGEWYPHPPVFDQLCEQDEHNDSREYLRVVRKGTRPRYTYDQNAFGPDQLQKFENDEFNTMIPVTNANPRPINPVEQPPMDGAALRTLALSEQGFSEASGVSTQSRLTRPAGGKQTATEVVSLEGKEDVRESYEQQDVAGFFSSIGRGLLRLAISKMILPRWIMLNSDPHSPLFAVDAVTIAQRHREVTYEQLGEADGSLAWEVTVDIESLSPVTEQQYASRIVSVLNLLGNPGIGRLLSLAPPLLKRVIGLLGIRNASDQQAIQMAIAERDRIEQAMMMARLQTGPGVAPMPGEPGGAVAPGPPGGPVAPPEVPSEAPPRPTMAPPRPPSPPATEARP